MGDKIKLGIVGYGNVGRGVRLAIEQNEDMDLVGIFTRRAPDSLRIRDSNIQVVNTNSAKDYKKKIDVMILCGGSATDLIEQGPYFASMFNTVDSFDTHERIPEYFESIDNAAKKGGNTSLISGGWDPGLFSINRLMAEAILPIGLGHTFWGPGISLGHSDAIRQVDGVEDGIQYTLPIESKIDDIRQGGVSELSNAQKHIRRCFVVAKEGADKRRIERDIKTMPNYFADYKTEVIFVDSNELRMNHSGSPHGGLIIHSGKTGKEEENISTIEYSLRLGSNAEFTASVLVAYARAIYRLNGEGHIGAKTVFDIAPAYLSRRSSAELRRDML
ncbi:MAG: diaminopimelate dehydrogenase [Clostridiales bacterium]|nr:diaminopimelate dehydrogenase [Clostridiales bacterium]